MVDFTIINSCLKLLADCFLGGYLHTLYSGCLDLICNFYIENSKIIFSYFQYSFENQTKLEHPKVCNLLNCICFRLEVIEVKRKIEIPSYGVTEYIPVYRLIF